MLRADVTVMVAARPILRMIENKPRFRREVRVHTTVSFSALPVGSSTVACAHRHETLRGHVYPLQSLFLTCSKVEVPDNILAPEVWHPAATILVRPKRHNLEEVAGSPYGPKDGLPG